MYWITSNWPFSKLTRNMYFHGKRDTKNIALTFDDGPCKNTLKVLPILKRFKAKGTFFVLGEQVQKNKEVIKKIISNGNEIGNHSYNHKTLSFASKEMILSQIQRTDDILKEIGLKSNLFRPPHGSFGFNLLRNTKDKRIIMWDIDPQDWRMQGVNLTAERILNKIKPGSIIDLHDNIAYEKDNTDLPKILEIVLPKLKKQGYKFVTVSELLGDF